MVDRHVRCPTCGKFARLRSFESAPYTVDVGIRGRGLGRARGWAWQKGVPPTPTEYLVVQRAARRAGRQA